MDVVYAREPALPVDDYIAVVGASTLGPTRPIGDRARVETMLRNANLIVTARLDGECVGIARGMSDTAWVCYLADLAVPEAHQGKGIGRGLMLKCKQLLGDDIGLALISMPDAKPFYDRLERELDLHRNADAYFMKRVRGA